jgi:hypothetical protein
VRCRSWAVAGCRVGVSGLLFVVGWGIWLLTGGPLRLLLGLGLLAFTGCLVAFVSGRGKRVVLIGGLVCVGLALSPLEVSLATRPGLPGIVPLVMGYPGPALRERARKGEVVLGGCMTSGFEPRWVIIW